MALTIAAEVAPLKTDRHGVVRVGGTRVTLDTVVYAFREGAAAEEIACRYPALDLADIYATITYYLRNRGAVDAYLRQREAQSEAVRQENETRLDPQGIRERLLARKLEPAEG